MMERILPSFVSKNDPVVFRSDSTELYLASLIGGTRSIQEWASGTAMDSEDTLNFSTLRHVRPLTETFPPERADEAYHRMMSNQVRFRAVLTPQQK